MTTYQASRMDARLKINNAFEIIKAQFDAGNISEHKYLEYAIKYHNITQGNAAYYGQLIRKTTTDPSGHKQSKWVSK